MESLQAYEAMAKIQLTDEERARLTDMAERLTESFAALEAIDTENTMPMVTVLPIRNILREDVHTKMVSREALLENAPEPYDGYFQVPKTIE